MSEAGTAIQNGQEPKVTTPEPAQNRMVELKVSGHLMTLDAGLFCVFQVAGSPTPNPQSGLPGVRVSLPPGPGSRPEAVTISSFRDDGWLHAHDSAALVRVANGQAQVLVTIYQAPNASPDMAPRLQVMRLSPDAAAPRPQAAAPGAQVPAAAPEDAEVVIHVQRTGDVGTKIGDWAGTRGSRQWIEGFSITPHDGISAKDIEYQAVLGRGWLSPWIEGGKFCGSRGMALPLLGLKVRLKGATAKTYECSYSGSFVDGSAVGPVAGGETCEAESLAALEGFQISIRPRGAAAEAKASAEKPASAKPAREPRAPRQPKPAAAPRRAR